MKKLCMAVSSLQHKIIACGIYANEIIETFGIEFGDGSFSYINEFASHPVTAGLTEVNGITARKIIVSGSSSEEIGWYDGCCCANDCLLAVNDSAGKGVVVAIGDE